MTSWDDEDHWTWANNAGAPASMQDRYPVFVNITMDVPHNPQQWIDGELVAFETDGAQQERSGTSCITTPVTRLLAVPSFW